MTVVFIFKVKLVCILFIKHSCYFCFVFFAGAILSAIYDEKKDEDGFLYVTYSGENTFGSIFSDTA